MLHLHNNWTCHRTIFARAFLSDLLNLLHLVVANTSKTEMTPNRLGYVFGPSVIGNSMTQLSIQDVNRANEVTTMLIENNAHTYLSRHVSDVHPPAEGEFLLNPLCRCLSFLLFPQLKNAQKGVHM